MHVWHWASANSKTKKPKKLTWILTKTQISRKNDVPTDWWNDRNWLKYIFASSHSPGECLTWCPGQCPFGAFLRTNDKTGVRTDEINRRGRRSATKCKTCSAIGVENCTTGCSTIVQRNCSNGKRKLRNEGKSNGIWKEICQSYTRLGSSHLKMGEVKAFDLKGVHIHGHIMWLTCS